MKSKLQAQGCSGMQTNAGNEKSLVLLVVPEEDMQIALLRSASPQITPSFLKIKLLYSDARWVPSDPGSWASLLQ